MYLMNWIWSHFTTISTFIVTLQRTTWNSIGNSCNVYDKTHGTSKVGECKNVTTELIFVIPLVLSLKILSGRNFYVFRVAFMRTFQKVLFLQPAYLFSTQNATQRNSTFKVYPELEQLQKAVRRDSVLFLFASRIGKMIPWKGFWRGGRGRRYLPLTWTRRHDYFYLLQTFTIITFLKIACLVNWVSLSPHSLDSETTARYKTDCCNETWSPQIPCCHPDQLPARWCSAQWQREPPWSQSGSCLIPTRTRSWPVLCEDSRGTWELLRSSKGCQGFILSSGLSCPTHDQPTNYSPPKAAWRGVGWPRSGHGSGWDGTKGGHCESNNLFLFYFLSWNFHNIWWSVSFTWFSPQNQVPKTCKNFIALCTGSSGYGYYHTTFHR